MLKNFSEMKNISKEQKSRPEVNMLEIFVGGGVFWRIFARKNFYETREWAYSWKCGRAL